MEVELVPGCTCFSSPIFSTYSSMMLILACFPHAMSQLLTSSDPSGHCNTHLRRHLVHDKTQALTLRHLHATLRSGPISTDLCRPLQLPPSSINTLPNPITRAHYKDHNQNHQTHHHYRSQKRPQHHPPNSDPYPITHISRRKPLRQTQRPILPQPTLLHPIITSS